MGGTGASGEASGLGEYLLRMEGISKRFPGVVALDGVHLDVRPGSVHALMGENGAGKSTLMKCLIGMYRPDAGRIVLDGREIAPRNEAEGIAAGISMIHQELAAVPEMTVAENLFLGREPRVAGLFVDHQAMQRQARELFDRWEIGLDPRRTMRTLSVAQAQLVEIAKAISYESRVVVMDEPTSAIPEAEVEHLHRMIRRLRAEGRAIVYITHKMDEVFAISDDITVLRDGRWVATAPASELTRDRLIALMVGREITQLFPKVDAEIGDVVLRVRDLNRGDLVRDVSFELRRGEILGVAGLMGAGRTEVLETLFGIHPAESGTVEVNGRPVSIRKPKDAIDAGLSLLTEDRKATGIMGVLSVRDNMLIAALPAYSPGGLLQIGRMDAAAQEQRVGLGVRTPSLDQAVANLSGGNQQKVLLSRWLLTLPDILMIDEPTRGIDVGAKAEIHRLMSQLAGAGKAIIMVSSELPEVLGMSDRVLVMHEGRIAGELTRAEATQERVLHLATGPDAAA